MNKPTGSVAEVNAIRSHINASIDATPTGATIRIATYSFGFDDTTDKLIAAQKRGVKVRVLIDNHVTTSQTARLTVALGEDRTKSNFVRRCQQGCMSSKPSVMHAKIYLFSAAGSSRLVSMVSSANLTSSSSASWNNINTLVGNSTVYDSLARYFDDMLKDVDNPTYYRKTTSGTHELYYYPRAAVSGTNTITILDALNRVKCSGAKTGYGYRGRTIIRIAMFQWAASRIDLAEKVLQLREQGCIVEVITNGPLAGSGVIKTLLKKSAKYGVMPVYDALFDKDKNGVADLYVHHKVVTINGNWNGNPSSTLVYAGSQNFTVNSTRQNNEMIHRLSDRATYDAYARNIGSIR
ncbi:MAG TPA: phospholipase D-like domain-containing protein, partial [Propionibacteriaceae bacterium]